MRTFLLDDDEFYGQIFRDKLTDLLSVQPDDVVVVRDTDRAFEVLRRNTIDGLRFDILFVDYSLGDHEILNGFDFIRSIKSEGHLTPAVIVTSDPDEILESRCRDIGVEVIDKDSLDQDVALREVFLKSISLASSFRQNVEAELSERDEIFMNLSFAISHEIKSKLGNIRASFQNFRMYQEKSKLTEAVSKKLVGIIDNQINLGVNLANLLMTAALNEEGIELEEFDIGDLVNSAVLGQEDGLPVEVDGVSGVCLFGNRFVFDAVLQILLKNIAEHGGPAPTVLLSWQQQRYGERSRFVMNVQDSGEGVPIHRRLSIFRPGDRGGKKIRYNEGGGLGLGLAFVRYLERLMVSKGVNMNVACVDPLPGWTGANFRILIDA